MHRVAMGLSLVWLAGCTEPVDASGVQGTTALPLEASLDSSLGGSCASGYAGHGVYDSTVLFTIDEDRFGPLFLDMDPERNTLAYRTAAYAFFAERYGLDLDPSIPGQQLLSDGAGGLAFVWPLKSGAGPTHQVYALDAQLVPVLRNRIPITNLALWNDDYFVFAITDFRVHGTYGGAAGATVRGGDLLGYGQYRMIDDTGHLFDVITFQGDTPTLLTPFTGDPATSQGATIVAINASASSPLLGEGRLRSIGEIRPLPSGAVHLDFRYVFRGPERRADAAATEPVCRNVPPVP